MAHSGDGTTADARCDGMKGRSIPLPVVEGRRRGASIRPSKSGKRRAVVLGTVQLLMIAHVVLWALSRHYGWWDGKTITPIEPSESMETSRLGVINAGFVFFAVALLSTVVLGRWFCGWGCHLVLLQDLCGWMMKKMGVRPKPFRSRFLMYGPLAFALYMFVWPLAYRGLVTLGNVLGWTSRSLYPWEAKLHLVDADFWGTFPGVAIAVPFLLICGFLTVYFLGAKGFCTYCCPYGGFFAPLDRLAAARIRVTDACEHCGHCTAVCTSNVRVHEEVREYGMVVDPGCMKCLDCVSVCPNDALYVGFGRPAVAAGPARNEKPRRHYDLTLGEEVTLAVAAVVLFVVYGGLYGAVPTLIGAGMSAVTVFIGWKLWRLLRDANVSQLRRRLKVRGALTRDGRFAAALAGLVVLFAAHSAAVSVLESVGGHFDGKVKFHPESMMGGRRPVMPPPVAASADRALTLYALASPLGHGGIGLFPNPRLDAKVSRLQFAQLDFDASERAIRRAIDLKGDTDATCAWFACVVKAAGRDGEAIDYSYNTLDRHPYFSGLRNQLVIWRVQQGLVDEACRLCRDGLSHGDTEVATLRPLWRTAAQTGRIEDARALIDVVVEIADEDAELQDDLKTIAALEQTGARLPPLAIDHDLFRAVLRRDLARAFELHDRLRRESSRDLPAAADFEHLGRQLLRRGGIADAVSILRFNASVHPDSWRAHHELGLAYEADGQATLAAQSFRRSLELNGDNREAADRLRRLLPSG